MNIDDAIKHRNATVNPHTEKYPLTHYLTEFAAANGNRPHSTFVDFSVNRHGLRKTLTWSQVHQRALTLAAEIQQVAVRGDRVAILTEQTLDYVVSFFASLYAGTIAVPLYAPNVFLSQERLEAVLAHCDASCWLTSEKAEQNVRQLMATPSLRAPKALIVVDAPARRQVAEWSPIRLTHADVAYLQYTSGSTRNPAGVIITHANVVANSRQLQQSYQLTGEDVTVGWAPLFHDMGLVLSIALPTVVGMESVFMQPIAYVQHPIRWLNLLSEAGNAFSAAPNFAYDMAVERTTEEQRSKLDLSSLKALVNGSEPVRPSTLDLFHKTFAPNGLRTDAQRPTYGLAEATVFATASEAGTPPRVVHLDRDALVLGRAVPSQQPSNAITLVSCGLSAGQEMRIIEPGTGIEKPSCHVGEIWLRGPHIGQGYWANHRATSETFGQVITASDRIKATESEWLRTGDLGVIIEDHLYIVGRLKDLIVIDGRNHYPQDIEATAQEAHEAIRPRHVAAFGVETGEREAVVVIAEYASRSTQEVRDSEEVASAVRKAVFRIHGIHIHDFKLVRPGTLQKTSSGKIARKACKDRYNGQMETLQ